MPTLIPIKYSTRQYPENIIINIQEVAGHFDVKKIKPDMDYSLHTEYSYGTRKYNSEILKSHSLIRDSSRNDVPQLWKSSEWSREFAAYLIELISGNNPPLIIEIHPPFNDYCSSLDQFLDIYTLFEKIIIDKYTSVKIFLENRSGTIYSGGKFLVSKVDDMAHLARSIKKRGIRLRIVVDFPQLFTAHNLDTIKTDGKEIQSLIFQLYEFRDMIYGMHIWGKRRGLAGRLVAHHGNLDTLFGDSEKKKVFLKAVYYLFDDDGQRYFVPEVNSKSEDLQSIVNDFIGSGFKFV